MADLSAVLRKTIDGLPKASPQMRGKVYEKARAAIARQIEAANPPLGEAVVEARRNALEDAITRTEAHYAAIDAEATLEQTVPPAPEPVRAQVERPAETRPAPPPRPPVVDERVSGGEAAPAVTPAAPSQARGPAAPERARIEPNLSRPPEPVRRRDGPSAEFPAPPVVPAGIEPRDGPDAVDAPFAPGAGAARVEAARKGRAPSRLDPPRIGTTEPSAGLDEAAIPAADVTAPRLGNGPRRAQTKSRRGAVLASLAVLLFAGAGTAAYIYLDDIRSALNISGSKSVASTTPSPTAGSNTAAQPSAGTAGPAAPDTSVAAVPNAGTPNAASPGAAAAPSGKRRFTQRLLQDGTEVDEGPGPSIANAFEEGTNIAAASPPAEQPATQSMAAAPATAPETAPATPEASTAAPSPAAPEQTASTQPPTPGSATMPAVAQKAVFYEERSETEAGTQRGGNVIWSVVQEPPAEGQPPEPAIRAVADVPEENLKLTLTIRRNTDATLPASHVIELMFDTPPNFPGGSIANVQRLALKPTEQARGEPLIGVAGKISDGFFIIALNNLSEATNTNIDLLNKEQWIDIPIAYATGRRALMSIEKGIPGDRAFKQAMDAWAGKT